MKWVVIHPRDLTPDLEQRWTEIQTSRDDLASPYFCPEFTQHVAAVRDDVTIGMLENNSGVVGFLPFHRKRGGVGRPIGLGLSDYHGVIASPDAQWSASDLLRGCGLVRCEFDHLPVGLNQFREQVRSVTQSPIVELAKGYKWFETSRDKAGRKQLREVERKRSRFEAEVGRLRFEWHSTDPDVLRTLMAWKSKQCRETGTVDYFGLQWCRELIQRLHEQTSEEFGGVLSVLYVGDELAAAHFALRSPTVLHSWFPVYNDAYRDYSPGLVLLVEVIRAAASDGRFAHLDFGKGMSMYKRRFMTSAIDVAEGIVELPSLLNRARQCRERLETWSRSSMLRPVLRWPGRVVKRIERKRRYG